MKKTEILFLTVFIFGLFFSSCEKDDTAQEENDSPLLFDIAFILADSSGENLLPGILPENPVVDPNSFTAHSNLNQDIGFYTRHPEFGHIFRIQESLSEIWNSERWQEDSTFQFIACFAEQCDTLKIYKPIISAQEVELSCFATEIIWGSDTIRNYNCSLIPASVIE